MSTIIDGSAGITFPNSTIQASAGSVIQVVNATYSTQVSTTNSTYVNTGLTATITPKFATSKILVLINHSANYKASGNANNDINFNLCKNGTQIVVLANSIGFTGTSLDLYFSFSSQYFDSPATTSATTYKTQFNNADGGGTVYVQQTNNPSTITLLEIAA